MQIYKEIVAVMEKSQLWKEKIRTNNWEAKLIILILTFMVLMVCFLLTYQRYVVPIAEKEPKEIFVNDVKQNFERVFLKNGMVSQTIRTDYSGLSAVSLKFVIPGKKSKKEAAGVLIRIRDLENSQLLLEREIPASQMKNQVFIKFKFDEELVGVINHPYRIEISQLGEGEVCLLVSGKNTYTRGGCFQKGRRLEGDISFSLFGSSYQFLKNAYYAVGLFFIFSLILLIAYLIFWKSLKLENIFLIGCLLFGILYSIVLPPFATPDESAHFITAYNMSNHILGKDSVKEERIQQDPYKNDGYFNRYIKLNTYRSMYNSIKSSERDFLSFYDRQYDYIQSSSVFSGHFVQAVAVTVGRWLNLGYMPLVYLVRIINLLFYCTVTYFAIRLMPFGRLFLFGVSFLPILLEEVASVSYDVWILSFAFLFIACSLRCIYVKEKVSLKDILILLLLLFACSNFKYVYYLMGGLLLLIPKKKLANRKQLCILFGIIAVIFLVMAGRIIIERSQPITKEQLEQAEEHVVGADRGQTYRFSDLLRHPDKMFSVIVNTIRDEAGNYLEQMIGRPLGSLNVSVHSIYIYALFLLLFLAGLRSPDDKYTINRNQGMMLLAVFSGVCAAVFMAMFVAWTNIESDAIEGVQGRYFLPVLPLVGLLLQKLPIRVEKDISRKIIYFFLIVNFLVVLDVFEYSIRQI